ncbi:TPA_asm: acetyl-CoA carboxylase, biotin carboxyl carrier protein [Listeria monocytogenes]|nr:acetyl-CoA carboxylase, biotin carboxyl carrier protein [Listeria monocytogenes]
MLSIDEIKQLIELIDESTLDEFELETKDSKILLKKNKTVVAAAVQEAPIAITPAQAAPVAQAQTAAPQTEANTAEDASLEVITSPMVGTFYASASPEDANFVSVGSKVSAQSVVCIVEAMKLFNEITADIDGEIAEILVSSGELVEFGQPLFKVRKK